MKTCRVKKPTKAKKRSGKNGQALFDQLLVNDGGEDSSLCSPSEVLPHPRRVATLRPVTSCQQINLEKIEGLDSSENDECISYQGSIDRQKSIIDLETSEQEKSIKEESDQDQENDIFARLPYTPHIRRETGQQCQPSGDTRSLKATCASVHWPYSSPSDDYQRPSAQLPELDRRLLNVISVLETMCDKIKSVLGDVDAVKDELLRFKNIKAPATVRLSLESHDLSKESPGH